MPWKVRIEMRRVVSPVIPMPLDTSSVEAEGPTALAALAQAVSGALAMHRGEMREWIGALRELRRTQNGFPPQDSPPGKTP